MHGTINIRLAKQVMTIPAVLRQGITLHNAAREVAAEFGRFILSDHKRMQKERAGACFVSIPYVRQRLRLEKAAVPEFYRQTMFEPEFLTTTWLCFFLEYRVSSRNKTYMLQENTGCTTNWKTRRMILKNT